MISLSGCSHFQPKQLPTKNSFSDHFKDKKQTYFSNAFVTAQETANCSTSTLDQRRDFLEKGLLLSDYLADKWLRQAYAQDVQSRYFHDTATTALGTATAVLGIVDGSSESVALLGAGSVAMGQQWGNYEAAYLLSSSLPAVIDSLKSARKALRVQILADFDAAKPIYTATQVRYVLEEYHSTASRENVKLFIQKSTELAKFAVGRTETVEDDNNFTSASEQLYLAINGGKEGVYQLGDVIALEVFATQKDELLNTSLTGTNELTQALFDQFNQLKNDKLKTTQWAQAVQALRTLLTIQSVASGVNSLVNKSAAAKAAAETPPADQKSPTPNKDTLDANKKKADGALSAAVQSLGSVGKLNFNLQVVPK